VKVYFCQSLTLLSLETTLFLLLLLFEQTRQTDTFIIICHKNAGMFTQTILISEQVVIIKFIVCTKKLQRNANSLLE